MLQRLFAFFPFAFMTLACSPTTHNEARESKSIQENIELKNENNTGEQTNWADSIIAKYIKQTDNELIRYALKDNISEEWLFDRIDDRNGASYLVFQIGHDVTDSGNTNLRFVTDSWLYIDSLSRQVYEYDLPDDSLIHWRK